MKTSTVLVGAVVSHDSLCIRNIHQPFSTCLDHSLHLSLLLRLTLVLPWALVLPLTLVALVLTLHLALALVLVLPLHLALVLPLHLALALVLQTALTIISSQEGTAPGPVLKPQVLPCVNCIRRRRGRMSGDWWQFALLLKASE